jgi:GTPase SAR1 family protein
LRRPDTRQWNRSVINVFGSSQCGKSTIIRALCRNSSVGHDENQNGGCIIDYLNLVDAVVDNGVVGDPDAAKSSLPDETCGVEAKLIEQSLSNFSEYFVTIKEYACDNVINAFSPLFMRKNVLTVLVFNMSRMVPSTASVELDALEFWFKKVAMYAPDAPVAIVGTHADSVKRTNYQAIGERLKERFGCYGAWRNGQSLLVCADFGVLPYFPVNGLRPGSCAGLANLSKTTHSLLDRSEHIHLEVSLKWSAFLENISESGHLSKTMDEVVIAATICDIPRENITSMLAFLHDVGEITWFPRGILEQTVILEPLKLLYLPVTRLLCTQYSTGAVMTKHSYCEVKYAEEYRHFKSGFISPRLIFDGLLEDYGQRAQLIIEVLCMSKVLIKCDLVGSTNCNRVYILPKCLSQHPIRELDIRPGCLSLVLFFGDDLNGADSERSANQFCGRGWLPDGLFESIVAKLANRASIDTLCTSLTKSTFQSTQRQLFKMTLCPYYRCIQVDIHQQTPRKVYRRIGRILQDVLAETFGMIQFIPYVPILPVRSVQAVHCSSSAPSTYGADCSAIFVNLEAILTVSSNHVVSDQYGGLVNLLTQEFKAQYAPWIALESNQDVYDSFISYRRNGKVDGRIIEGVLDALSDHRMADREVDVFYDTLCIESGVDFQVVYFSALLQTTVITPVLSPHALEKMQVADYSVYVDNVLVEWITALIAVTGHLDSPIVRVRRVVPIFIGSVQDDIMTDDIDSLIQMLPERRPAATIQKVVSLLETLSLPVSGALRSVLDGMTVRGIVDSIRGHTGIPMGALFGSDGAFIACSNTIMSAVQQGLSKLRTPTPFDSPRTRQLDTAKSSPSQMSLSVDCDDCGFPLPPPMNLTQLAPKLQVISSTVAAVDLRCDFNPLDVRSTTSSVFALRCCLTEWNLNAFADEFIDKGFDLDTLLDCDVSAGEKGFCADLGISLELTKSPALTRKLMRMLTQYRNNVASPLQR